jgi:hypothetical protein
MISQEQLEDTIKSLTARYKGGKIILSELTEKETFELLAYSFWKDGMDWELGISDIAEGKTASYNTREKCFHILKTVFGY